MIDPDKLLETFRGAHDRGLAGLAVLYMATLDRQLSIGGELPEEWKRP